MWLQPVMVEHALDQDREMATLVHHVQTANQAPTVKVSVAAA